MAGRLVKPQHGIGALVLGVIEVVAGLLIIILSAVLAGKADLSATYAPYYAGIIVSAKSVVTFYVICLSF